MNYKIKEKRLKMKMSQQELAEKAGLTRATIIAIEKGSQQDIKVSNLKKIAEVLNCSIADLICN